MSPKFRKGIMDVVKNRLPGKDTTAWELWAQRRPSDVVALFRNLPEAIVCKKPGIGPDQIGTFHAMLSWAAVLTAQPHQHPVPLQFSRVPLLTITQADRMAHALNTSPIAVHTEATLTRILGLHTPPWVSVPTFAGFLSNSSAQTYTPSLWIRSQGA